MKNKSGITKALEESNIIKYNELTKEIFDKVLDEMSKEPITKRKAIIFLNKNFVSNLKDDMFLILVLNCEIYVTNNETADYISERYKKLIKKENGKENKPWMSFDEYNVISGKVAPGYYIPSIKEFHVGFEYETKVMCSCMQGKSEEEWVPSIFGDLKNSAFSLILGHAIKNKKLDINFMDVLIESNCVRVKFLDEEDVENLGFKCGEDVYGVFYQKDTIRIIKTLDNTICIMELDGDEESYTLFNGNIKNKSELKKLLTQIGIL